MKKSIVLLTAFALWAGILTGCGGGTNDEANTGTNEEADAGTNEEADAGVAYLKDVDVDEIVTLGEYKGIEISLAKVAVTEEDIDSTINSILTSYPMPEDVAGAAEEGHEVNIDFVGKMDGVEFEGGSGNHTLVIGSGSFIQDLEMGLIGMAKGEVKDVPVTFPDPYDPNPDFAGRPAVFTVTMNSVQSYPENSEMTDEYVAWLTADQFDSIAGFRENLREGLTAEAEAGYEMEKMDLIADAVIESTGFKEIPQAFLRRIKDALTANLTSYASMYGMDITSYMISVQAMTEGQNAEEVIAEQSEHSAKRYLSYQAIANAENISVSDSELEEAIAQTAEESGITPEDYAVNLDKEGYKEYLMLNEVSKFLEENAVIKNSDQ